MKFYKHYIVDNHKIKEAALLRQPLIKFGSDILSRFDPVPSAQAGLTSLFGMGRGGPRRYSHQKIFNILTFLVC